MARRLISSFAIGLLVMAATVWPAAPLRPTAVAAQAQATPVAAHPPPAERCSEPAMADYDKVQEFPVGRSTWTVDPLGSNNGRPLYFLTITLEPGQCIPFESGANRKDGAVILIVHEGEITFVAEPFYEDEPDAQIQHGFVDAEGEGFATDVDFGTEIVVEENAWVSQNTQVWFTYWNNSDTDEAVIWKVVWANYVEEDGCGGDCK